MVFDREDNVQLLKTTKSYSDDYTPGTIHVLRLESMT